MQAAGEEVLACEAALARAGSSPVGEVLAGQGPFRGGDHFPKGDIYDPVSQAQFYYHSHRGGEHGHFHAFLRRQSMTGDLRPARRFAGRSTTVAPQDLTHLIAVSMDGKGQVIGLFTTNRWVTDETWYPAREVIAALDRFRVNHDEPSAWLNRWIGALLRLFRPEITLLLRARDETVEHWALAHPDRPALEDPRLDVTSSLDVSVSRQMRRIRRALQDSVERPVQRSWDNSRQAW